MTTGSAREKNGRFYARKRFGRAKRLEVRVPWAKSIEEADERSVLIGEIVDQLVALGRRDLVRGAAQEFAEAATADELARAKKRHAAVVKGLVKPAATEDLTFEDWAKRYTSGELAKEHPDHVKARNHDDDVSRLNRYILPLVGDVPVVVFGIDHASIVMSKLPEMSSGNRRHVAQIMGRLMHLAAFPGRLIKASPLPRGWLPKVKARRHYTCLFPAEDLRFLQCEAIAESFRLLCGILNREGMRITALLDSEWWQWGLAAGWETSPAAGRTFTATIDKGGDPRMWATRPDVSRAMCAWRRRNPDLERPFAYVEKLIKDRRKLAEYFRRAVKLAGVTRPELFAQTEHTSKLRAHDMRATFVTMALAEGKSHTWIRDRTGHKSTSMVDRYRRLSRQVAELKLGALAPLDEAMGWGKGGGIEASTPVPPECLPGGDVLGTLIELPPTSRSGGMADAADSKSALPSQDAPASAENPGEADVPPRRDPAFPHASPTPGGTSRDVGGGLTRDELESSTTPALANAAAGVAALRVLDDVLEDAHATLERELAGDETVVHRDDKPSNVMPPAKARPRDPAEVLKEAMRGGRHGR